jgi:uncharacterized protein
MRCPICQREATWEGNAFRPFCSERCRLLDLDNWLQGRYRISTPLGGAEAQGDDSEIEPTGEPRE